MLHPGWGSGDGVAPLDDFYLNFVHVWRIVLDFVGGFVIWG